MEKWMRMTRKNLLAFAEEVRDMARHAAVCAPIHGKDPVDLIENIDLDKIVALHFTPEDGESGESDEADSLGN